MSGSKQKTSQTSHQVTTPTNPEWVAPQIQGLTGQIANLAGQDPGQFIAPVNSLLTQAGQGAAGLAPDAASYDSAKGLFQGLMNTGASTYDPATVKPNTLLSNLQSYMSPYTEQVVDASLADFDHAAGAAQAQTKLAQAASDTFGGSGGSIQMASLLGDLARGRGTLSSTLRDQGFQTGANLSNLDANRRQQAQMYNADAFNSSRQFNAGMTEQALARQGQAGRDLVGTAAGQTADARANLGLLGDLGAAQQSIQQAQAGAPLSVLQALAGAYGGMTAPLSLLHGQVTDGTATGTTKQSGSLLGSLGSLAFGAGALGWKPFG